MINNNILFEKRLNQGIFRVYSQTPKEITYISVNQIHSNINLNLNEINENSKADGIISNSKMPLAIKTADCLCILLIGNKGHALIHAGWKGLQSNILLDKKIQTLEIYYAFISAHISQKNYEIQKEFLNFFPEDADCFNKIDNKLYFSLEKKCKKELLKLNPDIIIESSNICTFENIQYHSYRRDKTINRNWNIYIPQ